MKSKIKTFLDAHMISFLFFVCFLVVVIFCSCFVFISSPILDNIFNTNMNNWLINNPTKDLNDWLSLSKSLQYGDDYALYNSTNFFKYGGICLSLTLIVGALGFLSFECFKIK